MKMLAIVLVAFLAAGCASIGPPAVASVPVACVFDPALPGTWTDFRMTQLGPAWVEYSFGCDCSVKTRVQLMWMRITERARYSTNAGEIHYDRKGGPMKQSYRFDGEKLMLTDAPGEVYAHTRQGRRVSCPATSAPSYQAGFFPPL